MVDRKGKEKKGTANGREGREREKEKRVSDGRCRIGREGDEKGKQRGESKRLRKREERREDGETVSKLKEKGWRAWSEGRRGREREN